MIDVLDNGRLRKLEPGQALEQDRQHDIELQACQRCADAEVDACAERKIGRLVAVGLEVRNEDREYVLAGNV